MEAGIGGDVVEEGRGAHCKQGFSMSLIGSYSDYTYGIYKLLEILYEYPDIKHFNRFKPMVESPLKKSFD